MKRVRKDAYKQVDLRISNIYSDGGDGEETELLVRKNNYQEIPTIEKNINEGDTLQSLSIKYDCSVAELKRLNNIHKENEIFARNTIKVPNRAVTILPAGIHQSGNSSPENKVKSKINESLLNSKLNLLDFQKLPDKTDLNNVIFNSNIKNCDKVEINSLRRESSSSSIEDEEVQLLSKNKPFDSKNDTTRITCSGADADISWITLIICIIIVIFAVPLIYVLYIAEHPEAFHQHVLHETRNSS